MRISDCRASSILKTVPVSQDSKEYAKCKLGEFVHNNTKPLFRIAWHFWTNTKYFGEVLLIISVDIHRELTQCVRTWIFSKCQKHSLYAQARQSLLLLTQGNIYNRLRFLNKYLVFLEELNELFRFPRKLVEISDCRVSSFLKTVPGCRVSVSLPVSSQ